MATRSDKSPARDGADAFAKLPRPIVRKLEALIGRVRRVALLKGVLAVFAVTACVALAIMAIDASFTILNDNFRTFLSFAGFAVVLVTIYMQVVRPLSRRIGLAEIARAVEERHPEIEERIGPAVQLLSSDDPDELRGSEQLLAEVVKAASLDVREVRPNREFTGKRTRKPMIAAATAAAVIAAAFAIWPEGTSKLLARAFAPFMRSGNAYSDRLSVIPGNTKIPEGGTLTVEVEVRGSDVERAELRRQITGAEESVERMTYIEPTSKGEPAKFSLTFPAIGESFEYRIRSGRALSEYYKVEVVPRPFVEEYHITYRYPEYTRVEPRSEVSRGAEIAAVTGTTVRIGAKLDRAVKNATLLIDGSPIWSNQQSLVDGKPLVSWEFKVSEGMEGSWRVQLEDAAGIANRPEDFPLRALGDQAPTVRITSPSTPDLVVKPTETLPIGFVATEDFGILESQILIKALGEDLPPIAAELPERLGDDPQLWTGSTPLNLRKLDLGSAETIEIRIRVADSLPDASGGPGEAISDPIVIGIDRGAKSLLEQTLAQQQAELQEKLWDALEKLMLARKIADDKPGILVTEDPPLAETLLSLQEAAMLTGEAEATIRETADAIGSTLFADLAEPLNAAADDHIEPARAAAEAIPLTDTSIGRVHKARTLIRELEEAIAELQLVLRDLKSQAERAQMTAELSNIEDRKDQLEEMMNRLDDPSLKENLQEQIDELNQKAEELMEQSSESLAEQFGEASEKAAELAERAEELAEDQSKLAEMLADADDPEKRDELVVDLIKWLESEERGISRDAGALREFVKSEPELDIALDTASKRGASAADFLTQNLLSEAADQALENSTALGGMQSNTPKIPAELSHLAGWQESIAQQIASLGGGDIDEALSEMQEELAEQAAELAEQAEQFQEDAQKLADAQAAEQAMEAASQISEAAQLAAQANSQLGGQSGGSFQFSKNPGGFASSQNTPPSAPPPTQMGSGNADGSMIFGDNMRFERQEAPPDITNIDGTRTEAFEIGEVSLEHIPPAIKENGLPQGGDLPPGYYPPAEVAQGGGGGQTSGRSSGAGGASGSGSGAGSGLGAGAGALSGAASSLASQASTPMAQEQPEPITPETAQERMEELAAEIARREAPRPEDSNQGWARVGGEVKSGIATGSRGQPPAEYRDLVKRYFEEIARRSSTPTEPTP